MPKRLAKTLSNGTEKETEENHTPWNDKKELQAYSTVYQLSSLYAQQHALLAVTHGPLELRTAWRILSG